MNVQRLMLASVLALVYLVVLNNTVLAQQAGTLHATLSDPQGSRMPNVEIELRWNDLHADLKRPHKKWLHVTTDASGSLSAKLPVGNWDVFVYLDGFVPTCTVISILPETPTNIDLRMPRYVATTLQ